MDFFPVIKTSSRSKAVSKSKVSKLSLKSRRIQTQSQSYSQTCELEPSQDSNSIHNFSFSQPIPGPSTSEILTTPFSDNTEKDPEPQLSPIPSEKFPTPHLDIPDKDICSLIPTEKLPTPLSEDQDKNADFQVSPTPTELCGHDELSHAMQPKGGPVSPKSSQASQSNDIETIDIVSSSTEEDSVPLETELKDSQPKPFLEKLKNLRSMVEKTNTEELDINKISKTVPPRAMGTSKNKGAAAKQKPKQSKMTSDSDPDSEPEVEVPSARSLAARAIFASKLQQFGKPELKKITLDHRSSSPADGIESEKKESDIDSPGDIVDKECEMDLNETLALPGQSEVEKASNATFDNSPFKRPVPVKKPEKPEEVEPAAAPTEAPPEVEDSTAQSMEELPCPLCNKKASKNRRAHMKACAAKNAISTAQLLRAIELQQKQASERKALGLPMIVPQPNQKIFTKKKSSAPRVQGSKDSGMQLALALSRSLMEAEERQDLLDACQILEDQGEFQWQDEEGILPKPSTSREPSLPSTSTGDRQLILSVQPGGSLQLARGANVTRRRGGNRSTHSVLLHTTQEERERRVTQKVAMLLVGDDEAPRNVAMNEEPNSVSFDKLSSKLKKLKNKTSNEFWNMSAASPSMTREKFYVGKLLEFISPTKHQPGAALRHLSQIPGRLKSPERKTEGENLVDMSLCSFIDATTQKLSKEESLKIPKTPPRLVQPGPSRKSDSPKQVTRQTVPTCPIVQRSEVRVVERRDGLARDWARLLNNRNMSDITIYVRGELELRAHSLVLFVRCPVILEDIAKEMGADGHSILEQMLLWGEVSRDTGLAMLEFLYCDTTERATKLNNEDLEDLIKLAKQYSVNELLQHLYMLKKIRSSLEESNSYRKSSSGILQKSPKRTVSFTTPPKSPQKNISPARAVTPQKSISPVKVIVAEKSPQKTPTKITTPSKSPEKSISPAKVATPSPQKTPSKAATSSKSTTPRSLFASPCGSECVSVSSSKRSQSPDPFASSEEEDEVAEKEKRPPIDFLLSMMAKDITQTPNTTVDSHSKTLTPNQESDTGKRKLSPDSTSSSPNKKICAEASSSRKSLKLDDVNENSPPPMENMSSSQLLDFLETKKDEILQSDIESLTDREEGNQDGSPIISDVWDDFQDYGCMPDPYDGIKSPIVISTDTSQQSKVSSAASLSQTLVATKESDTDDLITISSNSQKSPANSQSSLSSPSMNDTVKRALEQSLDAFNDFDLSGIERAALNAYNKVVTPLPKRVASTPVQTSKSDQAVTPMADYSMMSSPALEKELDKYGIRRLRRNQAKLILRHIYNELHPLVPVTPVAGSSSTLSPLTSRHDPRGQRTRQARGRRGGHTALGRQAAHNLSLSQSEADNKITKRSWNVQDTSFSQPVRHLSSDEDSNNSDDSDSSSGSQGSRGSIEALEDTEDFNTGTGEVLETKEAVTETMARLITANKELHHRVVMYEPVLLAEFQELLKKNGKRCKPNLLLDYLDDQCITYRTPRVPRVRRGSQKKRSPRKKSAAASQSQRAPRGRKKQKPDF